MVGDAATVQVLLQSLRFHKGSSLLESSQLHAENAKMTQTANIGSAISGIISGLDKSVTYRQYFAPLYTFIFAICEVNLVVS
ncbi:MAG: hypothetical protein WBL68_05890 [Nitrososphaeraceae archaeon]